MHSPRIPTPHDAAIQSRIAEALRQPPCELKHVSRQWPDDAPRISDGAIRQPAMVRTVDMARGLTALADAMLDTGTMGGAFDHIDLAAALEARGYYVAKIPPLPEDVQPRLIGGEFPAMTLGGA